MAKPGTLVVSHYNPAQLWRKRALVAAVWIASLLAVYFYCRATMTPNFQRTQTQLSNTQRQVLSLQNDLDALKTALARSERGEQVAKEASNALQASLDEKQKEIQTLRSDLSFFYRFASGGNNEALGVQDISITATDDPRVFKYQIAVAQNLTRSKVASGNLSFSVTGMQDGKAVKLNTSTLHGKGGAKELSYEFKYFQKLSGTLYLPEKFTPNAIRAQMKNADGEAANKEVTWENAIKLGKESA